MAYVINAFVAQISTLEQIAAGYQNAVVVPLQQGFGLIPCTSAFRKETDADKFDPLHEFYGLTLPLSDIGVTASQSSAVAYIEAELFGGIGTQAAIAWQKGQLIFAPLISEETLVIDQALHTLGVQVGSAHDEFAALGLGRHRQTDEWLKEIRS